MDTGIGRQTYSIINQSQIDAILSVRPEDRRELMEEVAGVGKYRKRKIDALRKLDATRTNLLRVNDIVSELEGQLEPLSRQSEAAREHENITRELGQLKLSLLVADQDAFTLSLQKARERENELVEAVETSRSREALLGSEEVNQRTQMAGVETRQEEARSLLSRLTQELDRQEGKAAVVKEKLNAFDRQRENLEADCRQLESNLLEARRQQESTEGSQSDISLKEAEALRAIQGTEAALDQLEASRGEKEEVAASARREQLTSLDKISGKKNSQAQGASLLQAAENRLTRLEQEITAAQQEAANLTQVETEKHQTLEQLQTSLPELRDRLSELQVQREQAAADLEARRKSEEAATEKTSAARHRLEALEELVRAREGFSPAVQALLAEGFSVLSDRLKAPAKYSRAIEAALGLWTEALVCEDETHALQGRENLRKDRGQAGFLLLKDLPENKFELPANLTDPGLIGKATDLAECQPEWQKLFAYLLGRVLIAEDLEAALRLRPKLSASDWQIVTLEGEVVLPGGMILGKEKAAGVISRQAEIDELKAAVAQLEDALVVAQAETKLAQVNLEKLDGSIIETKEQFNTAEAQRASVEQTLEMLRGQLARNRQQQETLAAEASSIREEVAQSRRELTALGAEIAALETTHTEVESRLQASENGLRTLGQERETLARELSQKRVALANLQGERQAQEARLQSLQESEKTLQSQIFARQESLRLTGEEKVTLQDSLTALEAHLNDLRQAQEKAQKEGAGIAAERQHLLEKIAAQMEELRLNREERETNQASLHRLQLRITQLEGELDFLRRNLEEDHRISLEKAREIAQPVESRKEAQERAKALQSALDELGIVNLGAMEQYTQVKGRLEFLTGQREDLLKAREDLEKVIAEIDATAREIFLETFEQIQREFDAIFKQLFGGGETELRLTGELEILEAGVEVEVTVPGKRRQNLLLLSGGERALTAMALVFALLKIKPTPFVVLDEIDAPLDDSNVGRYGDMLRDFAQNSQFIVITHNKGTMEAADTLYGVTMAKAGVSTLIGMRLSELPAG
jgi:chromosome segregation protein